MTDAPLLVLLALAGLIVLGAVVWGLVILAGRSRQSPGGDGLGAGLEVLQREIASVRERGPRRPGRHAGGGAPGGDSLQRAGRGAPRTAPERRRDGAPAGDGRGEPAPPGRHGAHAGRPEDDGTAPRGGLAGGDRGPRPAGRPRRGDAPHGAGRPGHLRARADPPGPEDPRGLRRDPPRAPAGRDPAQRQLSPPAQLPERRQGGRGDRGGRPPGPGGLEVPARELPAHARGARRGAAPPVAAGLPQGRPESRRRDRPEVHRARREHLRLRAHVHPRRERVLRADPPGRGRGGLAPRLLARAPRRARLAQLLLRVPPGDPAGPARPPHRAERARDPRRPRAAPGRRRAPSRALRHAGPPHHQREEQVRRDGDVPRAARGEDRGRRGPRRAAGAAWASEAAIGGAHARAMRAAPAVVASLPVVSSVPRWPPRRPARSTASTFS